MTNQLKNIVANQNGDVAEKVSGSDMAYAAFQNIDVESINSSALRTAVTSAKMFLAEQHGKADNDNIEPDDDPTPPASTISNIYETSAEDSEGNSYQVFIDVGEIARNTLIPQNELLSLCEGANSPQSVIIPADPVDLSNFITINQGAAKTSGALAKKKQLKPEAREFFLKKSQDYGYLWLKSEVQLGEEIRKLRRCDGKRTDLEAKQETQDLDNIINNIQTKGDILRDTYGISRSHARDLSRLTDELVDKEYQYAQIHKTTPSRNHALSFLSQPPKLTDEELAEQDVEKIQKATKAKFDFDTAFSEIPYIQRRRRKLKQMIKYASLFSCVGSSEYYLEKYGFKCVLANELDPARAEYWKLMYPNVADVMIQGDFRKEYENLVTRFKESQAELLVCTNPCQTFCAQKGKDWRDDDRLTLVIDIIRFIKDTRPKYLVWENAREFFGFSFSSFEDLTAHPIAQQLQTELNNRTIGQYIKDELEPLGYTLNFSIEDACYYGTAQSRVRSILLASSDGVWKFPKAEEFAMVLFEAIGHLPSLEPGKDSGIPYHNASNLCKNPDKQADFINVLKHTYTGCLPKDNDPRYQLSGFAFFAANGGRKFWDKPSNTIDGGNGDPRGKRTIHPGRQRKDGTMTDCRPLTLLEIFLVNGLPQNYEVPEKFRNNERFIREVMGEIFLPHLLERICLELPIGDDAWEDIGKNPE